MIDLYTWATPNGRKVSILLEELGVPYTVKPIDIGKDEQFAPDFLRVAPNNRIPAIVDHETGQTLMETGAIMLYLGHKHGRFIGDDEVGGQAYWRVVEWLMWQMGGVGPMLGQVHHFVKYNPGKAPYAEDRYSTEARRLYRVLNTRLDGRDYVADRYSIADMAIWPWISRFEWQQIDLDAYPFVRDWYLRLAERPAVQRGYQIPHYVTDIPMPTRTTP